jgi:hypothetical protein
MSKMSLLYVIIIKTNILLPQTQVMTLADFGSPVQALYFSCSLKRITCFGCQIFWVRAYSMNVIPCIKLDIYVLIFIQMIENIVSI